MANMRMKPRLCNNTYCLRFKTAKIDVYVSGHDHNQQAIVNQYEPIYFISGGGGAGLYPIQYRDSQLKYGESIHGFLSVRLDKSAMDFTAA